jgi:hypothetical protein
MDIARLAVLIWIFLPIPVCGLVWLCHYTQIKKYPLTTLARIVNVSDHISFIGSGEYDISSSPKTNATYIFDVAGTKYTGQGLLAGTNHKPGEKISIRYNPERPEVSRLDDLSDTIQGSLILGAIVLVFDLGYLVFCISIGLLILFAGIKGLIRRPPEWTQWTPFHATLASLLCILIALPFVAIGLIGLLTGGFLNQNILWLLWNHQTIVGTPW